MVWEGLPDLLDEALARSRLQALEACARVLERLAPSAAAASAATVTSSRGLHLADPRRQRVEHILLLPAQQHAPLVLGGTQLAREHGPERLAAGGRAHAVAPFLRGLLFVWVEVERAVGADELRQVGLDLVFGEELDFEGVERRGGGGLRR